MDRVFLDANVLFSAAYGNPDFLRIWKDAKAGRCLLMASPYVIGEVHRNMEGAARRERLEELLTAVTRVPDADPGQECPADLPAKDRPVLMAAVAAGATHLLSGDRRAFGVLYRTRVLGVLILPPADYL